MAFSHWFSYPPSLPPHYVRISIISESMRKPTQERFPSFIGAVVSIDNGVKNIEHRGWSSVINFSHLIRQPGGENKRNIIMIT